MDGKDIEKIFIDVNFRKCLVKHTHILQDFINEQQDEYNKYNNLCDDERNIKILLDNFAEIKKIKLIAEYFLSVKDFTGIELLENLETFTIRYNNSVNNINLSQNKKLMLLDIRNCENLTQININNTQLDNIAIEKCGIKNLDISNQLKGVRTTPALWCCSNNNLETITIPKNIIPAQVLEFDRTPQSKQEFADLFQQNSFNYYINTSNAVFCLCNNLNLKEIIIK